MPRYRVQRLLVLTVGSDSVASSRVRATPAVSYARAEGWQTRRIQASSRVWPFQLVLLLIVWRPTILLVQKVALARGLLWVVRSLASKFIFELDDAIYLGYPGQVRGVEELARRVFRTVNSSDSVVVSNELIAADLQRFARAPIRVVPGPAPDVDSGTLKARNGIVWLGSPSTIVNLRSMVYQSFASNLRLTLTALGAEVDGDPFPNIHELIWSPEAESRVLRSCRVGLMPLQSSAWNDRKAAYKILEYLAYGVIPVAQPTAALKTLLTTDMHELVELVDVQSDEAWLGAIERANMRSLDERWYLARDRVFERLSKVQYARTLLGIEYLNAIRLKG